MKKFLGWQSPSAEKAIPAELDARILASAGIRARSLRRKRLLGKVVFPSLISTSAAAAVAVMVLLPQETADSRKSSPRQSDHTAPAPIVAAVSPAVGAAKGNSPAPAAQDMLALADISALEQECYNLTNIAEFSLDSDNFSI